MKPFKKHGYLYISLCNDNRQKKDYSVHVLVLQAFRPCNQKLVVHHIDRDKTNNRLSNLMWCTIQEHIKIHVDLIKAKKRRDTKGKTKKEKQLYPI